MDLKTVNNKVVACRALAKAPLDCHGWRRSHAHGRRTQLARRRTAFKPDVHEAWVVILRHLSDPKAKSNRDWR